jgi:Flp pilus assembly pilin Flp
MRERLRSASVKVHSGKGGKALMSIFRSSSGRGGQSFVEYALLLILVSIVLLSILLILGDDLRTFVNDVLQRWFPTPAQALLATLHL